MNRLMLALVTGCTLSALLPLQARADISDIRSEDTGIELNVGAGSLKYGEDVGGSDFDTETAWMPAFGASASLLTNTKQYPWLSNLFLNLKVQAVTGQTDYRGGLQQLGGPTIPYNSTNHSDIYTVDGQMGHAFAVSDSVMLIPLIDMGYRYWDRDIQGTGGYTELYQNGEAKGGLMVQYSPLPKWVFTASGLAGITFDPELHANGNFYNLGAQTVWQVGGKVGYTFTKYFEATTSVEFKDFGYGASGLASDGSYEPNSYTHEINTMLGIAYHLP
jgi:hypothetical protein